MHRVCYFFNCWCKRIQKWTLIASNFYFILWIILIIIIIIIIIISWQHVFPPPVVSLSVSLSKFIFLSVLSLRVGSTNYIQGPHWADISKLLLVGLHWWVHMKGFIKECSLWVRSCFFTCTVRLTWTLFEMGGKCPVCFGKAASRIGSDQHTAFLCFFIFFTSFVFLEFIRCIHSEVLRHSLEEIPFYLFV